MSIHMKRGVVFISLVALVIMLASMACLSLAVPFSSPDAGTLPHWTPDYRMSRSTIVMQCNYSGLLSPSDPSQEYALIDIDWSNARAQWAATSPMDTEQTLVTQAELIKAAAPYKRVFVYRNLVKALPWFSSVRIILDDPVFQPWFLKFHDANSSHVPPCDKNYQPPLCSAYYHDQGQTPQYPHGVSGSCPSKPCDCGSVPCGEYLFDHRAWNVTVQPAIGPALTLREWLVHNYTSSPTGALHPSIDGLFIDDQWGAEGPTEMDAHCMEDTGLSKQDALDITKAWEANMQAVQAQLVNVKAFNWQLFYPPGTCAGPAVKQTTCSSDLRSLCTLTSAAQTHAFLYGFTDQNCWGTGNLTGFQQDLVNFLLVRGDYAWLGYGWTGCNQNFTHPTALSEDYGVPEALCHETAPNSSVFQRKYSLATVTMDCNKWKGTIERS